MTLPHPQDGTPGQAEPVRKRSDRPRHPLLRRIFAALLVGAVLAGTRSAEAASVVERLNRIAEHLQSGRPNLEAAATRELREEIRDEDLDELRAYLQRPLDSAVMRALESRWRQLLLARLEALETRIQAFESARATARQLRAEIAARRSTGDEPEEKLAPDEDRLESLRNEREETRGEIRREYAYLRSLGSALAPALWLQENKGGRRSTAVSRFRERLWEDLASESVRRFPSAPDPAGLAPFESRNLFPLFERLVEHDPEGWTEFRADAARAALERLSGRDPEERDDVRQRFLELTRWGVTRMDRWFRESDALTEVERRRLAQWNRLGVPVDFPTQYAVGTEDFLDLTPPERLERIHRLEWAAGESAIPILARILAEESELALEVEAAAALARLSDPRGAEFLSRLGLESFVALERVSRRVLLLEAIHHREAGELPEAIQELEAILARYASDHRVHYELAYTALLARRFELSIRHFLRAIELQPDDQLAHYNLACAYALTGNAESAIDHLELAARHGFDDADHIRRDSDLESLRANPRFRALLERLADR